MNQEFYLPYLLNYSQPMVEEIVIFSIAMLTAIMVSAEGQGFVATFLGDSGPDKKDRLHFNVFLHMSILGTLNFFVAGFGWAKEVEIDADNFKNHPRLFLFLSRAAGPLANLLMANIAASLAWILGKWDVQDQVFSTIVVVNVSMALYSLIIIPPLPGFAFLSVILPDEGIWPRIKALFRKVGPWLIVAVFAAIRFTGYEGVSNVFNPLVSTVTAYMLDI
jgi:Zn-dependent protease